MDQTIGKAWYASQTIWGGIGAICAGLGMVVDGVMTKSVPEVGAGALAAAGGLHSIVGRFKATTPIGKALIVADKIVQQGVTLEPVIEGFAVGGKAPDPAGNGSVA